jgi:hypothetical protein
LELGPVGAAGALTPLDVLPNDRDGMLGRVAGARFALGGQGQAVLVEALVDLAA